MGIWDAVSSTTDAVRDRLPDPEPVKNAGRAAYSAVADKLPRGAPDPRTPIAGMLRYSYDHSRSALSAAGKAVRAERIKESVPDKEVVAKIVCSLTDVAVDKYSRIYTGGIPVYSIVKEGLVNKDSKAVQNIKADELQEMRDRMANELQEMRDRLARLEALSLAQGSQRLASPHCRVVGLHEKPEDVVRIFMMKGFTGADFLHKQVVPQHDKWRRDAFLCSLPSPNKSSGVAVGDGGLA